MSEYKEQAAKILNESYRKSRIDHSDYLAIMDGLCEIETLRDRDERLEKLWRQFFEVYVNPDTECLGEEFQGWPAGTHREEIWHWFDQRHSEGVYYLLYGPKLNPEKVEKLVRLGDLSFECESSDCCFNHKGVCRFALVHERKPRIHDNYGCLDSSYEEGFWG